MDNTWTDAQLWDSKRWAEFYNFIAGKEKEIMDKMEKEFIEIFGNKWHIITSSDPKKLAKKIYEDMAYNVNECKEFMYFITEKGLGWVGHILDDDNNWIWWVEVCCNDVENKREINVFSGKVDSRSAGKSKVLSLL